MVNYKLLTPGPLTTTMTVKEEMLTDHCTWDDDYKSITQKLRRELLELAHADKDKYTVILMQGSGTFGVESVISSVVSDSDKLLIAANGAYGKRIAQIAGYHKLDYVCHNVDYDRIPDVAELEEIIKEGGFTHLAMVHSETTTGILNDIESVAEVCRRNGVQFIVDAMSSFGGIDIDVQGLGIDYIISSANKCIQGVPGFSFIIAKRESFLKTKGTARSLALDLYDQWETMEKDGKWRFTSPTHTVLAFAKAIEELKEEGGIEARNRRYSTNNRMLIEKMKEMGYEPYISEQYQSPIITTFSCPENDFSFSEMYEYIKERGYAIYPGKLDGMNTFRIGNIGEIYPEDIEKLCGIIKEYSEMKGMI